MVSRHSLDDDVRDFSVERKQKGQATEGVTPYGELLWARIVARKLPTPKRRLSRRNLEPRPSGSPKICGQSGPTPKFGES